MKKLLIGSILTTLIVLGAPAATVSAWSFGLTGQGVCQPNGSFQITWKVDNSTENQALHITSSSNTAVVSTGTEVAAKKSANFIQNADGTKPGSFSLTLKGNWPGDQNERSRTATVKLDKACTQPSTPPVTPPVTTTGTVLGEQAQVQAPVGSVNAGNGSRTVNLSTVVLGLTSSAAILGFGLVHSYKRNR